MKWLSANRLKMVSVFALLGDICMGISGAVGIFHMQGAVRGDAFLTIGGVTALLGHLVLFVWGKGGAKIDHATSVTKNLLSDQLFIRVAYPWRYPLDSAFAAFVLANIFYMTAGAISNNTALAFAGLFGWAGSLIGWLWPENQKILLWNPIQFSAIFWMASTISTYAAAIDAQNIAMFVAALAYTACNAILYTVRKADQSAYTQR